MIGRILATCVLAASSAAAAVSDGGGRDVSVVLFSTHSLHTITVTPLNKSAWTAHCAQCAHEPLTAPLHIAAPVELFAGGNLQIIDDASGERRAAAGQWHLRGLESQSIDVVLTMPSERYVTAVLAAEASASEPRESMRAMAILVRTYALNGRHYTAAPGHLTADLCDSTQCQAMRLGSSPGEIEDAVLETTGETLWFGDRRAEVFFSQQCGGTTEDASEAWPGRAAVPYLRTIADPYCLKRGSAAWHAELPLAKLEEIALSEGWKLPSGIVSANVSARSGSHRALRVVFRNAPGDAVTVSASALRFGIGRGVGWDEVRSDAFDVAVRNGALVFDGRGHGHGVGLCQTGAAEMAAEGKSSREILTFYFRGTAVRITPGDDGWQKMRAGAIDVRTTRPLSAEQANSMAQTWADAQGRLPLQHTVTPRIVMAPSTEIFRQMTFQPGWALAATSGTTIVLQSESVLRANGSNLQSTLLHEMLHVLVELQCSERTPLWLREGLVEALSDPRSGTTAIDMSTSAIGRALQNATSRDEADRAHHAAAVRVRTLIARYGLPSVVGWLRSGVPAGLS